MLKKAKLILILLFALAILLSMILLISNITYGKYLSSAEFDMEFNFNVFDLDFEIWFVDDDGNIINGELTADGDIVRVKDADGNEQIKQGNTALKVTSGGIGNIEGVTLDAYFGADRLPSITNNSFYYTLTIDGRYTAEVFLFIHDKNAEDKPAPGTNQTTGKIEKDREGNTVNGSYTDLDMGQTTYWPLGAEPVYEDDNGRASTTPNPKKGPSALNLTYTYRNHSTEHTNYRVVVKLKEIKTAPVFDARSALAQENASGRGSTGEDLGYGNAPDGGGNIKSADNWNWNNAGEFNFIGSTQKMTKQADGTYSFEWTFQTNGGGGAPFILDSLQINGYGIVLPFMPKESYGRETAATTFNEHTKTTTLPNGTEIKVECIRSFGSSPFQRVYKITVSNARSNITVTYLNLMMYEGGAREIVVYSLNHVKDNKVYLKGEKDANGNVILGQYKDENGNTIFTPGPEQKVTSMSALCVFSNGVTDTGIITFQLDDFYEKPIVTLKSLNGKDLAIRTATAVKDENGRDTGWYAIENISADDIKTALDGTKNPNINNGEYKVGLLSITAEPMRFAFKYCTGSAEGNVAWENVPFTLDDDGVTYYWLDKNHDYGDAYYTIDGLPEIISIPVTVPLYNGNVQGKNFLYWTYTDWNGNVTQANRERPFYKYNIFQCAAKDENGNYIKTEDGAYIVIFNAAWSDDPVTFTFEEIYAIYCQEWSDMPFDVWYAECWEKWYAEYCDGCYSF